jgi:putative SOS response-associated peptidase YedK
MIDSIGNLEPTLDVYPDRMEPIVRNTTAGRELPMVRWGLTSSQHALMQAAKKRADKLQAKSIPFDFAHLVRMEPDGGTTNVRRVDSKHWTRWLGVENRCVVPFTLCRTRLSTPRRGRSRSERVVCSQRGGAADVSRRHSGAAMAIGPKD